MKKDCFLIVNLILFSFAGLCFADTQDVSITTYYPPPYSVYDALRLPPNNILPLSGCDDSGDVGTMHYDDGFGGLSDGAGLYMCIPDGGTFIFKPIPQGAVGTTNWTFLARPGNDVLHVADNNWVVGIGTNVPGFGNGSTHDGVRLHIADPNNAIPFAYKSFFQGTSSVIEGREVAAFQIAGELDSSWMTHLILSGINTTGGDNKHWFVSHWGPGNNENSHFGIGLGADGTEDIIPNWVIYPNQGNGQEYMTISKGGSVSIYDYTSDNYHGELDISWQRSESGDHYDSGIVETTQYCTGNQKPLSGGCDTSGSKYVQVRQSYPIIDPNPDQSGWRCECYYDNSEDPPNATINCKAVAVCSNVLMQTP